MATIIHSAKTELPGEGTQYLNIQTPYSYDDRGYLTVSEYSPKGLMTSRAAINLSPEQWAELAAIATELAKKNSPPEASSIYSLNADIVAERIKKVQDQHDKDLDVTMEVIARWVRNHGTDGWVTLLEGHPATEDWLIDELVEKGMLEFKTDRYPNGRPKVWYRITDNGQK